MFTGTKDVSELVRKFNSAMVTRTHIFWVAARRLTVSALKDDHFFEETWIVLISIDYVDGSALLLLNLSVAFKTIDRDIL